ncbi:MAG TPA: porin family protein [Chitinophagaceae bacterium]|nr:porin family protein [Chitinophagaceae bacterium]HRG91812.1 porin family protein [Chitinophagaceae bacterium]
MKKSYLLFIGLMMAGLLQAQTEFGVFAGGQTTWASYSTPEINLGSTKQDTKMKYGFQAGAMAKMQFEGKLYFAPAVFYSMKGYKVNFTRPSFPPDSLATDNDVTVHTFEFAPMLQYNFGEAEGHFFIKAGPSIDLQLFGKEKFNKSSGPAVSRNMKFSYGDYGRFGANLLLHLGYETSSGLIIYAHYTHGVATIVNTDNGPTVRHRALGLTIGKFFNRK